MAKVQDYESRDPIAWCPGCGNFGILAALKRALAELGLSPENVLMVSGIGQASKLPHYLRVNTFNGLHGRTLPVATGAKLARPDLTVIAVGGDGDGYAEGGNHFIHAMRRNPDLTYLVHNNQVYGLTKGQPSPTSDRRMVTGSTPEGNPVCPERPLALAVASSCSFVARGFTGEQDHLVDLMKQAVRNRGFSLLEILQPCVSFNKVNTFDWYRKRVAKLGDDHDPRNLDAAFVKALEWGERIPIGVISRVERETAGELEAASAAPAVGKIGFDAKVFDRIWKEFA
jgi:2-oxoglutarate ferredoxin oxidoreductase subunit beta